MEFAPLLNLSDPFFQLSAFLMVFNPLYWNLIAHSEYHHNFLSRLLGSSKKFACTMLALSIIALGLVRDVVFHHVVTTHVRLDTAGTMWLVAGVICVTVGQLLNIGSFYRLGFFGVFMGDYFGIFGLDAPVTAFPYSLTDDPMYWGSALTFLGEAFYKQSPSGIVLSLILAVTYRVAIIFESKMLTELYANKAKKTS